jgi:hypothetical protein
MARAAWFFVALFALVAVLAWSPAVKRFLRVDSCLDRGGGWNHDAGTCEYERPARVGSPPIDPR